MNFECTFSDFASQCALETGLEKVERWSRKANFHPHSVFKELLFHDVSQFAEHDNAHGHGVLSAFLLMSEASML